MNLSLRLTLLLSLVVAITLFTVWSTTRKAVLHPFAEAVLLTHLDQVGFLADAIEDGEDGRILAEQMNLWARLVPQKPANIVKRRKCRRRIHRLRQMYVCRGPAGPVAVETDEGWLVVRRDLDVQRPERRFGLTLLLVAVLVFGLSALVAIWTLRPVRASVQAMQRMASGDLSFRLPESGPREGAGMARAFNALADRVETLLRAERELMAGISHELRTPLTRLRLEIELLRDTDVSKARLDAMEKDLQDADDLIGELLELSRLSVGARKLSENKVSLDAVVAEAVERTPLPNHRIEVVGQAGSIQGDQARLVRVVRNLLSNAGKYAPAGTTVSIELAPARITVRDRGPGVPKSELIRLFEPFYRGHRAGSGNGLGLGLMIAQQVVRLHGGTVTAQNHPEGGLVVQIQLGEHVA
ncbi:MAG: HAMP domain-containing sensor histidine kinase [Myxococcota bacterium]